MTDNLTSAQRTKNMSHIRSTGSRPEEIVRKYLFSKGLRYRKNVRELPGTPDIVLSKYRTVIFVNGCFWHRHNCGLYVPPSTNASYWEKKISRNVERDRENERRLRALGWRVITVWECELQKEAQGPTLAALYQTILDIGMEDNASAD